MELTNEYLNERLRKILDGNDNFFDALLQLKEFEKEYKQSSFYKTTKVDLMSLVRDARLFYLTSTKVLIEKINTIVNSLDAEKLAEIFDQGGSILEANNKATLTQLEEFRELGGVKIMNNQKILDERDKEEKSTN